MTEPVSFRLRVRGAGGVQWLQLQGQSAGDAARQAARMGLIVEAVQAGTGAAPDAAGGRGRWSLLLFTQELLSLLGAGLNLTEAVQTLLDKERQPATAAVLRGLSDELAKGRNFSDVLADSPQRFPPVYVATVRASERTGDLVPALSRWVGYQTQFDGIRDKLVSAALYPALLLCVGGAVTLFLVGYVVPRFSQVYASAGRQVPAMSAALLDLGTLLHGHGLLLGAVALGLLAAAALAASRQRGRQALLDAVLGLPLIAPRARQFRHARFFRALGLLLRAGVPLPRALTLGQSLLGPADRERLATARAAVERGQTLSSALVETGLADPVSRSMLAVGERSGQLVAMLEHSARFHDDDLERWIDRASRLVEPLLMTLIGLVIGAVVVLMYLPIFELAGSLQ